MHRFVNSDNNWYNWLKSDLHDGEEIIYDDCYLPSCCNRERTRIAIEKNNGVYTLYISGGITCNKAGNLQRLTLFRQWLKDCRIMFFDFNDMRIFLQSLDILY